MGMFLRVHLYGLHLDAQYGQTCTCWHKLRSGEDWSSSVVTHTVVTDPTIRQVSIFLVIHGLWNCFRIGQTQSSSCDCGQWQTMNHIVDTCPLTKFDGGLNLLHEADDDAVIWLECTATAAFAKYNKIIAKLLAIFNVKSSVSYPRLSGIVHVFNSGAQLGLV